MSKDFGDFDLLGFGGRGGHLNFGLSNTFGGDLFSQFLNTSQLPNEMSSSSFKAKAVDETSPANPLAENYRINPNQIPETPSSHSEKLDYIGIRNNILESATRRSEAEVHLPENSMMQVDEKSKPKRGLPKKQQLL